MAIQPMALAVQNVQGNALGAFADGQNQAQQQQMNQMAMAQQSLKNIGSLAFGVMGGKLDGPPDPTRWEEALDMLGETGMNVEAFRGRADIAPIVARASVDALGQINNELNQQQLDQRIKEFSFQVQEALKGPPPPAPTTEMRNYEYGQANPGFSDWLSADGTGAPTYGTTVLTGRDAAGNVVPLQAGSGGSIVQSQLPDGVVFDPGALNAERAAGNKVGAVAGQAAVDLPAAQAEAQRIALQIKDLKASPGLDDIFGKTLGIIPNQWGPTIPGTNKANTLARIDQMTGNAFLNGRQLLKGQGQITDMESRKAEAAFARLSTAQSKDEFLSALDEFLSALDAGVAKMAGQSGATDYSTQTAAPQGQPLGDDPLGLF